MISTKQLDNGITINVEEIKGAKTISCFFAFKVGSLYENETNFGICHLLEHILFCGTKNRSSEQIKEDFNNCGTIFNGSTGVYHTRFYIKNIVDFFEKSFEIMADMISNPSFNKNEFIKEKKVVFEEMLRYKDIPNEELYKECIKHFYANSNLKNLPIGEPSTLTNLSVEDVKKFYQENYTTENCIISFAGNINFNSAKKLVEKYVKLNFGKPKINVLPFTKSNHTIKSEVVQIQKAVNQSLVKIFFVAPNSKDENYFPFIMLANILGGGTSSLLYKHLRDKLGLVYSINASTLNNYNSGALIINFATKEENVTTAINEICTLIKKLISKGFDTKLLEIEKLKAKINYVSASEQSITIAGSNNIDLIENGQIIPYTTILEKLNAISLNDVKRQAEQIFKNKNCLIGIISKNTLKIKPIKIK